MQQMTILPAGPHTLHVGPVGPAAIHRGVTCQEHVSAGTVLLQIPLQSTLVARSPLVGAMVMLASFSTPQYAVDHRRCSWKMRTSTAASGSA